MPRVSRKEADQHRKDVIDAASRLFREHGFDGVSVPAVMAEAGLTHGGFYGHFKSKEALAAEACARAFEDKRGEYDAILARNDGDKDAACTEFIKRYTGKNHRDAMGLGCPVAAMCVDVARDKPRGPVRAAFVAGVEMMTQKLPALLSRRRKTLGREETLARIAMLAGGLMLARSTKGHEISDEILQAVRKSLLEE
jgi:TetR/AcrR family transcriptional repressor of nem operon